jgi:hypothetical protein
VNTVPTWAARFWRLADRSGGNLCLALRHPANRGPSRQLIEEFVRELGQNLVDNGVLTATELAEAQRVEREDERTPA